MSSDYNGWKNWETWNVALWIGNDESVYSVARRYRNLGYVALARALNEIGCKHTPDGVDWNDSGLDIEALDLMLADL